jgi:hypothetical protein
MQKDHSKGLVQFDMDNSLAIIVPQVTGNKELKNYEADIGHTLARQHSYIFRDMRNPKLEHDKGLASAIIDRLGKTTEWQKVESIIKDVCKEYGGYKLEKGCNQKEQRTI